MWTWIGNKFDPAAQPNARLSDVANALGDLRTLSGVRNDAGGIDRELVVGAISRMCLDAGLSDEGSSSVDFRDVPNAIGVRVEAGRALTNNGAVLAVLRAAQDSDVRQLILVVPQSYKLGFVFPKVNGQLKELFNGVGIAISLDGVALLAY